VVGRVGCAIVGQTERLAPADRRLYAIRDATGTVDSIPLIVGSILSKKLAAGLEALVMDVKVGSGAQFRDVDEARELARVLIDVAAGNGMPTHALLTDMNQVLGRTAGNAVEVREAIDHLTGAASDSRLREVTLALTSELLVMGKLQPDLDSARAAAERALDSGAAAERFEGMVGELDGPTTLTSDPARYLPSAPLVRPLFPLEAGVITSIDVRAVGIAVINLGGGRTRETDVIDHSVGLTEVAGIGEQVEPGARPLAVVHARDDESADRAQDAIRAAYTLGDSPPPPSDPVIEVQRTV
jgi:thymidine phosphorylase